VIFGLSHAAAIVRTLAAADASWRSILHTRRHGGPAFASDCGGDAGPTANVTADTSTLLWTAAFDLRVTRPFVLGSFALAPSLGLRAFSGRRDVRVNQQEQLVVPLVVPEAALWLIVPGD